MTTTAAAPARTEPLARRRRIRPARVFLHFFLLTFAVLWLIPVVWVVFTSFRPYADTALHGYVSWPHHLSLANYRTAWTQAELPHYFFNSLIIAVPAIVLILLLASSVAFVVSRFSFWFNVPLLIFFMAANLLPPQVILTPLYSLYLRMPLPLWLSDSGLFYDSYIGLIAINVAFQTGFCTFVLANYMKTIPSSLNEAARVDGASVIAPVLRDHPPALQARARRADGARVHVHLQRLPLGDRADEVRRQAPDHLGAAGLQGQFFTNNNLIAAASILVVIPTIVIFALLQRQFISGLTLGASKE